MDLEFTRCGKSLEITFLLIAVVVTFLEVNPKGHNILVRIIFVFLVTDMTGVMLIFYMPYQCFLVIITLIAKLKNHSQSIFLT